MSACGRHSLAVGFSSTSQLFREALSYEEYSRGGGAFVWMARVDYVLIFQNISRDVGFIQSFSLSWVICKKIVGTRFVTLHGDQLFVISVNY